MIMTPRDFPQGFSFEPILEKMDMKCIGVFPESFQFNHLVLMLIATKMREPYVQN